MGTCTAGPEVCLLNVMMHMNPQLLLYRWLYSLMLTIDANFRLKNKDRSVCNDPALGDGWGHWVPKESYHKYLAAHGRQDEVSVIHHALMALIAYQTYDLAEHVRI
jgi:hypothetical protein